LLVDGLARLGVDGQELGIECMHALNYCMYITYTLTGVKRKKEVEKRESGRE
jgi:hypothetical protein